ncbi:MAG: HAD family hydrolase [Cyanobacteria bacterium SIG30]|nr:HAD family hydrolase [Cyanobacteria bacterium SIG30]
MFNLLTKNWELKNIETVLLDKDGTFVDLHYFWGKMTELRAYEIVKRFNLKEDCVSKICKYLGFDLETYKMLEDGITALYSRSKIIEIFKENLLELNVEVTIQELENIFDYVSEVFYKNIDKYIKEIEEAVDFIKKAHSKGIKLGVVTSDSVVSTKMTLEILNLEKYFGSIIGRESCPELKESGTCAKMALEELCANPDTAIMIGDTPIDYMCAKNAGIKETILVATGQISKQKLLEISKYSIDTLKDVKIV